MHSQRLTEEFCLTHVSHVIIVLQKNSAAEGGEVAVVEGMKGGRMKGEITQVCGER